MGNIVLHMRLGARRRQLDSRLGSTPFPGRSALVPLCGVVNDESRVSLEVRPILGANAGRREMTTAVATHGVGNMDTWLAGGDERATMFKEFCTGYRVFRHGDKAQVSLFLRVPISTK